MSRSLRLVPAVLLVLGAVAACRGKPERVDAEGRAEPTGASASQVEGAIDLRPGDGPLRAQLVRERARAGAKVFIVQTTASWCPPCKAIKRYASDPAMVKAMSGVHWVRVDVDDFATQLDGLGLEFSSIPSFVKMDEGLKVTDAINGGEWKDDIPENMAPVLSAFAQGTLAKRKHRFSAGRL